MDPLQEIPRNKWVELRKLYEINWPKKADCHTFIDTHISCPNLTESMKFKFYSPEGDIHNGMIAISDLDKYQVGIYPVNDDLNAIENALLTTSIIDWNRPITVPFVTSDVLEMIKRVCEKLGVNIKSDGVVYCKYLLNKGSQPLDIKNPPNTTVGPLKPAFLKLINDTWRFRTATSYQYFEQLMNNDMSYVLYSDDQKPLAWIFQGDLGTLCHLFCLEDYRAKGYGELVHVMAVNDLLKKGRNVFAYIVEDNHKSHKKAPKLGFQRLDEASMVYLSKDK